MRGIRTRSIVRIGLLLVLIAGAVALAVSPSLRTRAVDAYEDFRTYVWRGNDKYCLRRLEEEGVKFERVKDWENGHGCGVEYGVRISRLRQASLGKIDPMTCRLAELMDVWLDEHVQPAARELFGSPVATVHHYGVFSCRTIRGNSSSLSEHAFSNAIDVTGFTLANGRRINILHDWHDRGANGAFLRRIAEGACQAFDVTLTPEYNADHRDHFHLDAGPWSSCRI